MTRKLAIAACVAALAAVVMNGRTAMAAEIRVLSPVALRGVMSDVVPQFERSSGHKALIETATVGSIVDRLLKGEAADAVVVAAPQLEELQKQGKIVVQSRNDIARVGVAVFVRAGTPKIDISSVDAFKSKLLSAKSIIHGDPSSGGVSGIHMANVVERLGIAAEMKPKTQLRRSSQEVLEDLAKDNVEIGMGLTSDAALTSGIDLVGPLPTELQNFTVYSAGAAANSKEPDAAKAFIAFLSSPTVQTVLKSKGFEPR